MVADREEQDEVHCIKCGAAAPDKALFCPHCGARTPDITGESVPSEQGGSPGRPVDEAELQKRRRKLFIYGFALVVVAMAVGRCGSWIDFDFDDEREWGNPPVAAEASLLFDAYRRDKEDARKLYGGRGLIVTGDVVRIDQPGDGQPDLMLKTSDAARPLRADLREESHGAAAALKPGQRVVVSCVDLAENLGPDPILRSCRIDPAPPAPVPAGPKTPPASGED